MQLVNDKHNILLLKADNQYELTSTFWRLQEYYESPKFRNKFPSIEEYMDWYAAEYGNFTYFTDWCGFNVPGNIVRKFFKDTPYHLFEKEFKMYELIKKYIEGDEKFYLLGVYTDDATLDHEYSHAFYHLFPKYKKEQSGLLNRLSASYRSQIGKNILEKGYHKSVLLDETIAYLSTNDMITTKDMSDDLSIPWAGILELQENFHKWKEDLIDGC